jgi:hypothetical protein
MPWWLVVLAVLTAVALLAVAVLVVAPRGAEPAATTTSSTTTTSDAPADREPEPPDGLVAYVDDAGRVLVGEGAGAPVPIASDAALGDAGLGAVAIAPTADALVYVRADASLVLVPLGLGGGAGGDPVVLATDVALGSLGRAPVLGWDATGTRVAYLAVGTEEMVRPRPAEPPPLSNATGVFRAPLPEGELGDVVKVVERDGTELVRIGDPSVRSMVGVVVSSSDDLMLLESVAPDTGLPYTLALAGVGSDQELPTVLSADEPAFSPDGNFVVAVGPGRGRAELLRIATDSLDRASLAMDDRICAPAVSPDSTRIVYAAGADCDRLMLISSRGGTPVDVTPAGGPGDRSFRRGALGWTEDGRWITVSDCRATDGPTRCGGPVTFLEPDLRRALEGPVAGAVAPYNRPLLQDLRLDLVMDGPIAYEVGYELTSELEAAFEQLEGQRGRIDVSLAEEERSLRLELQLGDATSFATGRLTVVDPDAGIDRSFLVLATPVVIGTRVVSLSGMWISTDELPVLSGEFRLGVRRG